MAEKKGKLNILQYVIPGFGGGNVVETRKSPQAPKTTKKEREEMHKNKGTKGKARTSWSDDY